MFPTIGIDQGLRGGLCFLTGLTEQDCRSVVPMPVRKAVGTSKRPDVKSLKDWLYPLVRDYGRPRLVIVERSQAMSKGKGEDGSAVPQGVKSVATTSFNAGIIIGCMELLKFPLEEPSPQQWKKAVLAGFGEKDKEAMFAVCRQRFPSLVLRSSTRSRKDHDGMADAVGLALYGQYRLGRVPT